MTDLQKHLEASNFEVIEKPAPFPIVKSILGKNVNEDTPTGYKFIMNAETNQILSCKTNDYKLVKNVDLYNAVIMGIEENQGTLAEVQMFSGGRRTMYQFTFPNQSQIIKGDELHPELRIWNSYDGSMAISIIASAFRMICSNGMIMPEVVDKNKNRHLVGNTALNNIPELIQESLIAISQYFQNEILELMQIRNVNSKHVLDVIKWFPTYVVPAMMGYIKRHGGPKSYWDLYNICTWIATHQMPRDKESTIKLEESFLPRIQLMSHE